MTIKYDEDLLNGLNDFQFLESKLKSKIMTVFEKACKDFGIPLPYDTISPQSIASKGGNLAEKYVVLSLTRDFKNSPNKRALLGAVLADEIKEFRREAKAGFLPVAKMKKFCKKYHTEYKDLLFYVENPGAKLCLPDVVVINDEDKIIRVAELKLSGDNDSSSVPENLDKLVLNSRNSAIRLWNNSAYTLERGLLIIASSGSDGHYPSEARWKNSIRKNPSQQNIIVASNENAYNWLSGEKLSSEEYEIRIINTVAVKLAKSLDPNLKDK